MTVEVRGLDRLQRRLQAFPRSLSVAPALKAEAELIAEAARSALGKGSARLAQSIGVLDAGEPNRPAFAVGSADGGARHVEFGTRRMRAEPWLWPSLLSRSRAVKERLRQLLMSTVKNSRL